MFARQRRRSALVASVLVLVLLATACGKSSNNSGGGSGKDEGKPVSGGSVTYGLEAETSAGFCLTSAQLVISGIEVANTIYDTLVVPNQKGDVVPYLAQSITPSANNTVWTIKLRPNIKFHDGTPFNAAAVKLNLDGYRQGILFQYVFPLVTDVKVVDDLTVEVSLKSPWARFPDSLWSTGRLGMMAPAQINAGPEGCKTKLIGTGPFTFSEYVPNVKLVVKRNPNYWLKDKNGTQLPYLDQVTFVPQPDAPARQRALESGELTMMQTNSFGVIAALKQNSNIKVTEEPKGRREVSHALLNVGDTSPFKSLNARLAFAYAINKKQLNEVVNRGKGELTNGVFDTAVVGNTKDTGLPEYNVNTAKEYVAKYKAETGKDLEFRLATTNDPETNQIVKLVTSDCEKVGIKVVPINEDQGALVIDAIANKFDAFWWRNYPGTDPDTDYVWWHSGNLTNFGKINDPVIDDLFTQGRESNDPAKRQQIYSEMNKRLGSQAYSLWGWWAAWAIASQKNVNGITNLALPDANGNPGSDTPYPVFVGWQLLTGTWLSK